MTRRVVLFHVPVPVPVPVPGCFSELGHGHVYGKTERGDGRPFEWTS